MTTPPTNILLTKVQQIFPDDDSAEILALLDLYGTELYERERERVQLACLKLSEGSKDKLLDAIEAAKRDYRDALAWAEYPGYFQLGFIGADKGADKLDAEGKRKLIEQDLHQYLSWLQDTDKPDMSQYQEESQDED